MTGRLPGPFEIGFWDIVDPNGNKLTFPKCTAVTLSTSFLSMLKVCIDLNLQRIHVQQGSKIMVLLGRTFVYIQFFAASAFFRLFAISLLLTYITFWTIFPVGMFAFEMWTMVEKMINYDRGDQNKWNFFIVLFSFAKFVVICTGPFLRVNIIVDGKVDLDSKWSSGKIVLLFGLLVDTIGSLWQAIETPVGYYQNLYLLILVIPAVIIQKIQIACGIIVFSTAVSWMTKEGEETDTLSIKEHILTSRKLIQRFNCIQQGSGIFLFVMCFYCAMMSVFYAWVGMAMFKFSAVSSIPFFHVALGNILMLKGIITSAHDAHESFSKQKTLLR